MKALSKYILGISVMVAGLVSCEESVVMPPQELYLRASVKSVGLTSFEIKVDVPTATPFYIAQFSEKDFERFGITPEGTVADIVERVSYGATWASVLKVGSQTVTFSHLNTDTNYKVMAFGLNGAGEITTEPVFLDVTTSEVSFDLRVKENGPFGYTMEVSPSREDMGWYAFSFIGSRNVLEAMDDELIKTYMNYYISSDVEYGETYDEIVRLGTGNFQGDAYPDLSVMFTVCALDKDLRLVSEVKRMIFDPDLETFLVVDEKNTEYLHTLIYAYDHKEMGVLLHVTGHEKVNQGVINNAMSFNGDSRKYFGIDFYTSSDSEIGSVMASMMQSQFDSARKDPQYIPYFEQCTSAQQMMEMIWYTPANVYDSGRVWDRNPVEDIIEICRGEMPDEVVFVLGINKITNDYRIYPAEYCVSRAKFSALGYEFAPASAAGSAAGQASASAAGQASGVASASVPAAAVAKSTTENCLVTKQYNVRTIDMRSNSEYKAQRHSIVCR